MNPVRVRAVVGTAARRVVHVLLGVLTVAVTVGLLARIAPRLLGGELTAGPDGGVWRLAARLPAAVEPGAAR